MGLRTRPAPLTLRLDHLRAGVPVVHVSGYLDHRTAPDLQHLLNDQLAATAPWAIVVDLSALSVLKPDAIPTLVHVAYRAGEADIGLCLVTADYTLAGLRPMPKDVLVVGLGVGAPVGGI
jgi:anti-anti-sigma factor